MSYEGYNQILCENGHETKYDAHDDRNPLRGYSEYDENNWRCRCGTRMVWWSSVDQTNGIEPGEAHEPGYVRLGVKEKAKTETCNLGHAHIVTERTYWIPKHEGHRIAIDKKSKVR